MSAIYSDRFAAAGSVPALLIWAFPVRFLSGHARWSLVAAGQLRWLLGAEIVGTSVLVMTAWLAIPAYSSLGAAAALLAGLAVRSAVTQVHAERTPGQFGFVSNILPALLAAPAALFLAWMLSPTPIAQAGIPLVCFFWPCYSALPI